MLTENFFDKLDFWTPTTGSIDCCLLGTWKDKYAHFMLIPKFDIFGLL